MQIAFSLSTVAVPTAIALGNFDGIHRGHRRVIEPVLGAEGLFRSVVSFNPHPQEFFTGQRRTLLTPLDEKVARLEEIGVEQLVLIPFDQSLAALSPDQFVEQILVECLQTRLISVGENFRFGHRRAGDTAELKRLAIAHGITVQVTSLHICGGERISSSAIRQALDQGDLDTANRLLGRPYRLVGTVVEGRQLGRTIGFPTANLVCPADKFLPRRGVYAVQVTLEGSINDEPPLPGVMNLGLRPTVDGIQQTIEVHVLDWSGDLYGQVLSVDLQRFLRPEQKFASLEALKYQIQADCDIARQLMPRNSHSA
ncbi:MAG: bifunctional riboflavin kinase/FAD synthetase [Synechococcales bacterium]|nr:bifunctional riboflavin kinase/FAD synthetase [Synechococcales bacterium]